MELSRVESLHFTIIKIITTIITRIIQSNHNHHNHHINASASQRHPSDDIGEDLLPLATFGPWASFLVLLQLS